MERKDMTWTRRSLRGLAVAACALLTLACSKEPELMQASKCVKAGTALEDPVLRQAGLMRLAQIPEMVQMPDLQRLALTEELDNQLGHADLEAYFRKARAWRDSAYCQELVTDFKAKAKAAVEPLLQPARADAQGNVSCADFEERMAAAGSPVAEPYRPKLRESARLSVEAAQSGLKDYQASMLAERLKPASVDLVLFSLRTECRRTKGTLNQALAQLPELHGLASPTTEKLQAMQKALSAEHGCGTYPELLCLITLRREAVDQALALSQRCDRQPQGTSGCDFEPEALTQTYLRNYEVRELERQRQLTQAALDGEGPPPRDIDWRAQENAAFSACQHEALQQGLRGEAYYAYKNSECSARARSARRAPLQERLGLIEALLKDQQDQK